MASADASPGTPSEDHSLKEHISTTTHEQARISKTQVPIAAPVLGTVGSVGKNSEGTKESSSAFEKHDQPSESHTDTVEQSGFVEKETHVTENEKEVVVGAEVDKSKENANGEEEEEEEDAVVYLGKLQLGFLTLGLCLVTFTVALDNTIIATAIPKITSVFDSLNDVGWYGSSYLLTTTALQPSFGRVYTYFNVKYTYIAAIIVFEIGSVICAAAKNSSMLIVGRAVAGTGASGLFSGSMTIIGFSVPLKRRAIFIAALSSMFGISSVVGPLLGGVLTDKVSWRWCFWINIPFGVISIAVVWFFFKPPVRKDSGMTTKQKILEIDLLGALFLICAIVCLLLALQWGGTQYAWSNSKVWGCILGFGLLLTVFIALQFRRGDRATIPPRIFLQKTVFFSSMYSCFLSMGLYTHIFYVPFYFQAVKGTTAEESGIRTIPYLGSIIVSSIIIGAAITALGWYKPFMIFGSAIFAVGAGMIYTLTVKSSAGEWVGYQFLSGLGAGCGVQIPFVAVQVVLSPADMPTGNAIAIFFNSLGGAIAISIAQNVFSNGLSSNLPKYAPDVDAQTVIHIGATSLKKFIAPNELPAVLKAYMAGLQQAYVFPIVVGGIATICACGVEWKNTKGKKIVAAAGA
ncbi:related to aflatoxin efflux pump AFLT [Rhynchosporium graminicola]|uniref:Related to aflatoxin efflux pump AFLT n=1 Tax=Rhynchosporium graminicola TaxID=2792576 RepID=A0A1E1JVZ4_9HELO|nr:related to aflatoxin efflux pump AFLT [Rhynchosporium commune]